MTPGVEGGGEGGGGEEEGEEEGELLVDILGGERVSVFRDILPLTICSPGTTWRSTWLPPSTLSSCCNKQDGHSTDPQHLTAVPEPAVPEPAVPEPLTSGTRPAPTSTSASPDATRPERKWQRDRNPWPVQDHEAIPQLNISQNITNMGHSVKSGAYS